MPTKRRGTKRKMQQKKTTGGQWKSVDEHVEQLRRKTACLNRLVTHFYADYCTPIKIPKKLVCLVCILFLFEVETKTNNKQKCCNDETKWFMFKMLTSLSSEDRFPVCM